MADPSSVTASAFMELGAAVVREISKLQAAPKTTLRYMAHIRGQHTLRMLPEFHHESAVYLGFRFPPIQGLVTKLHPT